MYYETGSPTTSTSPFCIILSYTYVFLYGRPYRRRLSGSSMNVHHSDINSAEGKLDWFKAHTSATFSCRTHLILLLLSTPCKPTMQSFRVGSLRKNLTFHPSDPLCMSMRRVLIKVTRVNVHTTTSILLERRKETTHKSRKRNRMNKEKKLTKKNNIWSTELIRADAGVAPLLGLVTAISLHQVSKK